MITNAESEATYRKFLDGCTTWLSEETRFDDFKLTIRYAEDEVDVNGAIDLLKQKAGTFTVCANNKQAASILSIPEDRLQAEVDIHFTRNADNEHNLLVSLPEDESNPDDQNLKSAYKFPEEDQG